MERVEGRGESIENLIEGEQHRQPEVTPKAIPKNSKKIQSSLHEKTAAGGREGARASIDKSRQWLQKMHLRNEEEEKRKGVYMRKEKTTARHCSMRMRQERRNNRHLGFNKLCVEKSDRSESCRAFRDVSTNAYTAAIIESVIEAQKVEVGSGMHTETET